MVDILIVVGLLVCALQAIRTHRLLHSALWLAGASALAALLMYRLGAPEVAVIELSVGAGLVTVLFVFAINIAGEDRVSPPTVFPRPLAWFTVLISLGLLSWMNRELLGGLIGVAPSFDFSRIVWEDRMLDMLLQIALIFTGVLGVLGLLAEKIPEAAPESLPEVLTGEPLAQSEPQPVSALSVEKELP